MLDPFGRPVENLRVSVTRQCNLACSYCHKEGHEPGEETLTVEQLEKVFATAAKMGLSTIKLTGGEPLLRNDLKDIISAAAKHFEDVSITTNGILLGEMVADLKAAGLDRVNISLDTLDPERYEMLTGTGRLQDVIEGIMAAKAAGIAPIKINTLLLADAPPNEFERLSEFCAEHGLILQIIEFVAKKDGDKARFFKKRHRDLAKLEYQVASMAVRSHSRLMQCRKVYTIETAKGQVDVEIVRPNKNPDFCLACNRLRITSDGRLKPCLLSDHGLVDLGPTFDEDELEKRFKRAIIARKPFFTKPLPQGEGTVTQQEVVR